MIGNLFLNFKTCEFINCTFNLKNSKSHECCITVVIDNENELEEKLSDNLEYILRESKAVDIKDNEYCYDVDYNFEKIEGYSGDDNEDIDFNFKNIKNVEII